MLDPEALKRDLLETGKLSAERLAEAERAARDEQVTLEEALVGRLMISFPDLGEACARITGMPYVPLMSARGPRRGETRLLSPAFAAQMGTYPIAYDPRERTLLVAVQSAEQGRQLSRMLDFFMQDVNVELTIAPEVEIARANERLQPLRRTGRLDVSGTTRQKIGFARAAPSESAESPTKDAAAVSATPRRSAGRAPPPNVPQPSYADMSQALVSAATLLVHQQFAESPERMHAVRTRVRYGQLMATRLRLTAVQADALTLAGWLSMLGQSDRANGQLNIPYRLEEVLNPSAQRAARAVNPRIEGLILSLIACYQELKIAKPEVCRDVNHARRELFLRWAFAQDHQEMLETFLQILVDEEFLEKLGRSSGRVLIVDPEELALCTLAPPLISMGYDVIAMPDTRSARDILDEFKPDLILLSVANPPDRAVWFCERLKGDARTASIPILAVVEGGDSQLPVKCLRAGANDFLAKPVNAELLFLKVQNHLSAVGVDVKECGVSGSLDEMSFTDMIQILSAGHRSVDIFLNSDTEEGRVYIRDGEVVHACIGNDGGENAFYALMRWTSGTFTTRQCGPAPERTIQVSTMALLMEGSRQADETSDAAPSA